MKRIITNSNSLIYRAILKYGYINFTLEILEYCETNKDMLLQKEQYYMDTLKPEYNIMKQAGSVLGLKHTKDTIKSIRLSWLGLVVKRQY